MSPPELRRHPFPSGPVPSIVSDAQLDLHRVSPELDATRTVGEVLLTPTKIYVKPMLDVIRQLDVHGVAHITGGGFDENIPRIFQPGQGFCIHEGSWEILPVFRFLERHGRIPHREMFNIYNMGIGMVFAIDAKDAEQAIRILEQWGEKAQVIGHVQAGDNQISGN